MDEVYAALVDTVSAQVVSAVLNTEELDGRSVLGVDVVIRDVLRRVGALATRGVVRTVGRQVVEEASVAGFIVNRSAEIELTSIFGPLTLDSPYLLRRADGTTSRPVRDQLGITHRMKTPGLERALTDFGIEDSFGLAASRFEEHYGWSIHRTSVLRVVHQCASEAEAFVAERLAREPEGEPAWGVLVEMDGCEIRTAETGQPSSTETTPVRGIPKRKRPWKWRDVRMAFARRIDGEDKTFVGALAPFPVVVEQLHQAARHHGLERDTLVAAVIDGGNGLREAIDARFGEVLCVLDRPHLSGHLHEVAKAMDLSDKERFAWVSRTMQSFHDGRVDAVFEELQSYTGPGEKRVTTFLNHLWRFQDAVDYGFIRHFGIPLGSGEIESAHKYIPQRRLKISGASWRPDSINPLLALRIIRANGWWQDFWSQRSVSRAQVAA